MKPVTQLLRESPTRDDAAQLYAACLSNYGPDADWRSINEAVIDRWSLSGLRYVKDRAWKLCGADSQPEETTSP